MARYGAGDEESRQDFAAEVNVSGAAAKVITVGQCFDSLHPTSTVAGLGNLDPETTPTACTGVLAVGIV